MVSLAPGILLISDPFLKDPNFTRTVVLLCEHQPSKGSFGFVLNRLFDQTLNDLVPDVTRSNIPVYYGGPVQIDTIHFIHQQPELIKGGFEIVKGVYWGGEFDTVIDLLNNGLLDLKKIKFFIGYSGWSGGQLDNELNEKAWILSNSSPALIFETEGKQVWQQALRDLGSNFAIMANFPIDPLLN
jgi:putative transcriptional regulator